jgi:hypothetical protein
MSTLTKAYHQWAMRPADERFGSLEALHAAVEEHHRLAVESRSVPFANLSIEAREVRPAEGDEPAIMEPVLIGGSGKVARFSHHAFGQFAQRVHAPAGYLRTLPVDLAVTNLRHGLATAEDRDTPNNTILFAKNEDLLVRAFNSDSFARIWNRDISSRLIRLHEQQPEWQPAPAAFDGSRGLYASAKDLFAFMVDNDRRIFEKGPGGGLSRGFFVENTEVGGKSFRLTTFWYEYVCGNHRVWGAKGVTELRIPHIGDANDRAFREVEVELKRYADLGVGEDEAKVKAAMKFTLGTTKDDVLDRVFGLGIPKKLAGQAYDLAVTREDWYGSPHSAWAMSGALTEIARDMPHADARVELERQSGKVLAIAF